jgi:hypothetical protein
VIQQEIVSDFGLKSDFVGRQGQGIQFIQHLENVEFRHCHGAGKLGIGQIQHNSQQLFQRKQG